MSLQPSISMIVPALNEGELIGRTLAAIDLGDLSETIVVDGGSDDDTVAIARAAGAKIVTSPPGRGRQMNVGGRAATGDLLLFCHADTLLPEQFDEEIRRLSALPDFIAGAFALQIDAGGRGYRLIEKGVMVRTRRRSLPYGDQAIFMRRSTFDRVGGFREIAAMEDYEMIRRLRRIGRIYCSELPVQTSARRWRERGIVRMTLLNQICIAGFHLGVSPDRLARWRTGSRGPQSQGDSGGHLTAVAQSSKCDAN